MTAQAEWQEVCRVLAGQLGTVRERLGAHTAQTLELFDRLGGADAEERDRLVDEAFVIQAQQHDLLDQLIGTAVSVLNRLPDGFQTNEMIAFYVSDLQREVHGRILGGDAEG